MFGGAVVFVQHGFAVLDLLFGKVGGSSAGGGLISLAVAPGDLEVVDE